MRKVALIVAVALGLAGCGTLHNPLTKDRLTTIKEGYGIVLSGAIAYHDACAKRLIANSCRVYVPKLVSANEKVEIALANLNRIAALGSQVSYLQALEVLSDAVNDLKVIAGEAGVR